MCKDTSKRKDPAIFFTANQVFHKQIYAMAHNSILYETIMDLDKRLSPYRRLITFRPGRVEESIDEHGAILNAIEQNDSDNASRAMQGHLDLLAEDARALARATS
jgi:DNA-binding GntR family transcriptional regulator